MELAKVDVTKQGNRQALILPETVHLADEEVYAVQIGTSVMLYTKPRTWEEWWKNLDLFTDVSWPKDVSSPPNSKNATFYLTNEVPARHQHLLLHCKPQAALCLRAIQTGVI